MLRKFFILLCLLGQFVSSLILLSVSFLAVTSGGLYLILITIDIIYLTIVLLGSVVIWSLSFFFLRKLGFAYTKKFFGFLLLAVIFSIIGLGSYKDVLRRVNPQSPNNIRVNLSICDIQGHAKSVEWSLPEALKHPNEVCEMGFWSESYLQKLPAEVFQFPNLKVLRIGNQQAGVCSDPKLAEIQSLEVLWINDCQLTTIPSTVFKLHNLKSLFLSGNKISSIPPQINQLKQLEELELAHTEITTLPDEIGDLKGLAALNLNGAPIEQLPGSIDSLNLTMLTLSETKLSQEQVNKIISKHPHTRIFSDYGEYNPR